MEVLYRNRTLVGNISLVVFLAFLVTLTFGMFPGTAAAAPITPTYDPALAVQVDEANPVKVQDKNGDWQSDAANLLVSGQGNQLAMTVQVLTAGSFENILLDIAGLGQVSAPNVSSATYQNVYGTVYSVYQLIYTWVSGSPLNTGYNNDYTLLVYSDDAVLSSIILDLEKPPHNERISGHDLNSPRHTVPLGR